jgi:DNA topoisomerase-1
VSATTTPSADRDIPAPGRRRLVIVESPAKAKTIAGYLGRGYVVESSIGHIRDLPRNAADVPASHKGQSWARLGVDVDHGFTPLYVVSPDKKSQVAKLKALLKNSDELYLATDEDREGEAIAWHLLETLKPKVPVRRMVFHEITPQAIRAAVEHPRELDRRLVDAQETRRIIDRLYGYEVSPVLWKKVLPKLSAGRVQSVATRMVVERERARIRFRSADWWDITGDFARADGPPDPPADPTAPAAFGATLAAVDGRRVATGKDFVAATGALRAAATSDVVRLDEPSARGLAQRLANSEFSVRALEDKPYRRTPAAPFMTSTLQQEAGRKLRLTSQRAMQTAQRLYENGYITYMRTDSTNLSETALAAARDQARALYGPDYVPDAPRVYAKKVRNAQEAHEAIRPSGDTFRTPGEIRAEVSAEEFRLYELIWQRTVASQMADARGQSMTLRIGGTSAAGEDVEFTTSGTTITFPGFLRAYVEGSDDPDAELDSRERRLPRLERGTALTATALEPQGHTTTPPARYTEASLVKALEEMGVGRPSTYASIIATIQDRGYVWKKGSALVPTWVAFAVIALLEQHFARLVDYGFTASMEDDLDDIAGGEQEALPWLHRFYFGGPGGHEGGVAAQGGLKQVVTERLAEIDARGVNSIALGVDADGDPVVVRVGRFGPYVQRGDGEDGARASVPEDLAPDELTVDKALELLAAPSGDRMLGQDPQTGYDIVARSGRYGPYVTTVVPAGSSEPARTASLFASMNLDTVTLDDALRLLTLPRVLGIDPADGAEITAQNGRYGPYVKKGTDSRSLQAEEELLTVTLEEALALLAAPKQRRGQRAPAPPLRTVGLDPANERPMVVKEGRFGPYVTDGETNASLRTGDNVETLTEARAAELLADRRARGPAPRKSPQRTSTKAPAKPARKAAVRKAGAAAKAAGKVPPGR